MKLAYTQWISSNYPTLESAMGRCSEATEKMVEAFPELRRTNGFISVPHCVEDLMHWWCVTSDGIIVDPTKIQYGIVYNYQEIDDSHPARNYEYKKCPYCGECYYKTPDLKFMHTEECENSFIQSFNYYTLNR